MTDDDAFTPSTEIATIAPHRAEIEVTRQDPDAWIKAARPVFELASRIFDTPFVPKGLRGSEPATAAAMLYGREIGLSPMTSLSGIDVIEGKPGVNAETMRAMILAAGHELEFTESTGASCTLRGRRRGSERWTSVTWTIDMGRAAGLSGKDNWRKYPRTQLQARCTTELARMMFPDVIHGFRSLEELDDMTDDEGAETTAQGPAQNGAGTVTRAPRKGTAAARKRTQATPVEVSPTGVEGEGTPSPAGPPLPGEAGFDALDPAAQSGGGDPPPPPDVPDGDATGNDTGSALGRDTGSIDEAKGSQPAPASPPTDPPARRRREARPAEAPSTRPAQAPEERPADAPETRDEAPAEVEATVETRPARRISQAQLRMMHASFGGLGLSSDSDREERLLIVAKLVGHDVDSTSNLTVEEGSRVIDTIATAGTTEKLWQIIDAAEGAAQLAADREQGPEVES